MCGRGKLVAAAAVLFLVVPVPAAAHGLGPQGDLPAPLELFLFVSGLAVVAGFGWLVARRSEPRWQGPPPQRPLRSPWAVGAAAVLRAVGVIALTAIVVAGIAGIDNPARNLAPVLVNVYLWLALPMLELLVGDLYTLLNPWRSISHWTGLGGVEQPAVLRRLGVWPATLAYLGFVWVQVVSPWRGMATLLGWAALGVSVLLLVGARRVGADTMLQIADPFTTYNRLAAGISPLGRDTDGRLHWRGWLSSLAVLPRWPGLPAFVAVVIGGVFWDGLSFTPWWAGVAGAATGTVPLGTVGLVASCALVWGAHRLACGSMAAVADDPSVDASSLSASTAHALAPFAVFSILAHYLPVLLFEGQLLLSAVSDPLGLGWDLFGTADRDIVFFAGPRGLWWFQAAAVTTGAIASLALIHDRALALVKSDRAVRSQYGMLLFMVALTASVLTVTALG